MSSLDQAKELIARGEGEKAIGLLASILIKNKNELEAWLLLGDMIDDPSRKRDCYKQVLRLSPNHSYALTKLEELKEPSLVNQPVLSTNGSSSGNNTSEIEQKTKYVPPRMSYPEFKKSKVGVEIVGYVVGGIAGFLVILYVIASPGEPSRDSNSLYIGLIFLSLILAVIIISASHRNRG